MYIGIKATLYYERITALCHSRISSDAIVYRVGSLGELLPAWRMFYQKEKKHTQKEKKSKVEQKLVIEICKLYSCVYSLLLPRACKDSEGNVIKHLSDLHNNSFTLSI